MANTSTARRTVTKKASAKKASAKKASTKKTSAKKPAAKKAPTAKTSAKTTSTKSAVKKAATKPALKPATKPAKQVVAVSAGLVAVGAQAPDFTLPNAAGKPVSLSSFKGKPVVVYFYPKDDTSGCTAEACDFRDHMKSFRALGCTVLGISPDSVKSHARFEAKYGLGDVTLLADEPEAGGAPVVCSAYGVWQEKSMYGRAYMGVVRTTYVVAKDGTVAQRFDKVSVTDHAAAVLAAVKASR
ncbi:MAG: thioredoxin-dependent thiol peroxidase [Phycisphaerales bacterium]